MPEQNNQPATRYVVAVDPKTNIETVAAALQSSGIRIAAKLDFIRTFIVSGDTHIVAAAMRIDGIKSIEPESTVRTQD